MAGEQIKNKIIRGNYGKVWIDGELMANVKSFEAKVSLEYEEVDIQGELGKYQRYVGYSIAGTILLHKVDSKIINKLDAGIRSGALPDVKVVARLADPQSAGAERVELIDVTFDEATLLQYENKKVSEESVPFKASAYNYLDYIV